MEKEIKKFMILIIVSVIVVLVGGIFSLVYYKPVQEKIITEAVEEKVENKVEEKKYRVEKKDGNTYVEGLIVVNKQYPLIKRIATSDNPNAKEKLMELIKKMQELGFDVNHDYGGIRSYDTQLATYEKAKERYQEKVDLYEAKAGNSERETGLTFDLYDTTNQPLSEKKTVTWLHQHAHNYGFIIRLPQGKESSTGFMGKDNRIRYIGNWAKEVYESKLSFEEFFKLVPGVSQ